MKGKANHPMEDYHVAKFARVDGHELGLFAIYDGHLGSAIPAYLQKHLFANILNEVTCAKPLGPFSIYIVFYLKKLRHFWLKYHACSFWLYQGEFWTNPGGCISKAYEKTDQDILQSSNLGRGGSTAVTAILINGQRLWVANVGDSRAVLSRGGQAIQMTIDHEPSTERGTIENKGGFVSNLPGFFSLLS